MESFIMLQRQHTTSNTSYIDSPSNMDAAANKLQILNRERFTHTHTLDTTAHNWLNVKYDHSLGWKISQSYNEHEVRVETGGRGWWTD